jgi:hypothetical protein
LDIAAGGHNFLGLMDDVDGVQGHLVSWGYNIYSPHTCTGPNCGNNSPISQTYIKIAAGHMFELALRPDGHTIDFYGEHDFGEDAIPSPSPDTFYDMMTGRTHAVARYSSTNLLAAWGCNPPTFYDLPTPPAAAYQYWGITSGNSSGHHLAMTGCFANCDGSTTQPVLTANDFQCFQNEYARLAFLDPNTHLEEQIYSIANCDGSTTVPVLTSNDFQCFLAAYAAGCP